MPSIRNSSKLKVFVYRFDATLNRHIGGALLLLLVTLFLVVTFVGLLMSMPTWGPNEKDVSAFEGWWLSLTRSLDPGTFGADGGQIFRFLGLIVTLCGLLALAIAIGLISNAVDNRVSYLRSGRAEVMEKDHYLVLGWSNKAAAIVNELLESAKIPPRVVILSTTDRDRVEDEINRTIKSRKALSVVVRTGDPTRIEDLTKVKPVDSNCVIVIEEDGVSADALVVRTVMTLMRIDSELVNTRVIAEVSDANIAQALKSLATENLVIVDSAQLVAKITAQTLRNPGLSIVYEELLDFEGDEIYVIQNPNLTTKSFLQISNEISNSVLIGYIDERQKSFIGPDCNALIEPNYYLLVFAQDKESIQFGLTPSSISQIEHKNTYITQNEPPENYLIYGWSELGPLILRELDYYAPKGSTVTIAADARFSSIGIESKYENFVIESQEDIDTTNFNDVKRITESSARGTHSLVLCYRENIDVRESDARTLLTISQLRKTWDKGGRRTLISELLEINDIEIAQIASPDDYVVSEKLTSLLIAQIAVQPELAIVLNEFFSEGGHDITFRNISEFSGSNYSEIRMSALSRNLVPLGFRLRRTDNKNARAEIELNPSMMSVPVEEISHLIVIQQHQQNTLLI